MQEALVATLRTAAILRVEQLLAGIRSCLETLRPFAADVLESAEASRDGRAIQHAARLLGQIDSLRAVLAEEMGAPPPQRRPREREHPYSVPTETVVVKRCP